MAALSKALPRRQPARIPIHVPTTVANRVAVPTRRTVGQNRSQITEYTGWRNWTESTSLLNGWVTYPQNWVHRDSSRRSDLRS